MELREYLRIIIRRWWVILPLTVIAMTIALLASYAQTPVYEATMTYVVTLDSSGQDAIFAMDTLAGRQSIPVTYCEVMSSATVRRQAIQLIGLDPGDKSLAKYEIKCTNLPGTNVLFVAVTGSSRTLVKRLSDGIAVAGVAHANGLYANFPVELLDDAQVEEDRVSPKISQNTVIGTALGLVIGIIVAFMLEYLRNPMDRLEQQTIRNIQLGVYNERYFQERLGQEIERANAHHRPVSVAVLKLIPTEEFQLVPEDIQVTLVRRVLASIQNTVGPGNIVAYLQPQTFGVLLVEMAENELERLFQNLNVAVRDRVFEAGGYLANFEVAIGISFDAGSHVNNRNLLEKAYQAVDKAREQDNSVHFIKSTPSPFFGV